MRTCCRDVKASLSADGKSPGAASSGCTLAPESRAKLGIVMLASIELVNTVALPESRMLLPPMRTSNVPVVLVKRQSSRASSVSSSTLMAPARTIPKDRLSGGRTVSVMLHRCSLPLFGPKRRAKAESSKPVNEQSAVSQHVRRCDLREALVIALADALQQHPACHH